MAKTAPNFPQNSKKSSQQKREMPPIDFINIYLSEDEQQKFHDWSISKDRGFDDFEELLGLLVNAGYKISIKPDYDNDCYVVSTTGEENTPNHNCCVSSRSDDLEEALMLAYYKVAVISAWGEFPRKPKRKLNWG
jgi:hypothetical protein